MFGPDGVPEAFDAVGWVRKGNCGHGPVQAGVIGMRKAHIDGVGNDASTLLNQGMVGGTKRLPALSLVKSNGFGRAEPRGWIECSGPFEFGV